MSLLKDIHTLKKVAKDYQINPDLEIHGPVHWDNSYLLSLFVAGNEYRGSFRRLEESLRFVSMFHDIGRVNEGLDEDHPDSSWDISKEVIPKFWPDISLEPILFAIRNHSASTINRYEKSDFAYKLLTCFRDGDRLDIIRLKNYVDTHPGIPHSCFKINKEKLHHGSARRIAERPMHLELYEQVTPGPKRLERVVSRYIQTFK